MTARRQQINIRMGKRLKAIREEQGYSQEWVAQRVGIQRSSLCNLEYGRQNITLAMLGKFGKVYDLSIALIIQGVEA